VNGDGQRSRRRRTPRRYASCAVSSWKPGRAGAAGRIYAGRVAAPARARCDHRRRRHEGRRDGKADGLYITTNPALDKSTRARRLSRRVGAPGEFGFSSPGTSAITGSRSLARRLTSICCDLRSDQRVGAAVCRGAHRRRGGALRWMRDPDARRIGDEVSTSWRATAAWES